MWSDGGVGCGVVVVGGGGGVEGRRGGWGREGGKGEAQHTDRQSARLIPSGPSSHRRFYCRVHPVHVKCAVHLKSNQQTKGGGGGGGG